MNIDYFRLIDEDWNEYSNIRIVGKERMRTQTRFYRSIVAVHERSILFFAITAGLVALIIFVVS